MLDCLNISVLERRSMGLRLRFSRAHSNVDDKDCMSFSGLADCSRSKLEVLTSRTSFGGIRPERCVEIFYIQEMIFEQKSMDFPHAGKTVAGPIISMSGEN